MKRFFKYNFTAILLCLVGFVSAKNSETIHKMFETPTKIQGLTVVGEVEFYPNGNITFARLANNDSVFGHWLYAKTGIHFTEDGKPDWCFLAKDTEVQGYLFNGGGHEWQTCFYPSGRLLSGGLTKEQIIDSIPCAPGTFWNEMFGGGGRTYFYENGKLKAAKVNQTVVYRGQKIKAGKHIHLDQDGSIQAIK